MVNFFVLIKTVILLLLITLPSCKKNNESTLVIADITKIDKETTADSIDNSVIGGLLFSNLSYIGNDLVPHNLLAEKIRVLPGGKAIEIKIRNGVRFHDGREMTESDVAASLSEILERDTRLKEKYGQLRVAIVDKLKVTVTGDKPLYDLNVLLPTLYVSSKNLVGTGPFMFHGWIDKGVELAANNDYFEGKPILQKVIYQYEPDERKRVNMLLKGEADLLIWLSPEMAGFLKKDDRFHIGELNHDFYSVVFLNNTSPLFSDKTLRRAVSMAINRDGLIKKILKGGGRKAYGPLPSQIFHPENNSVDSVYRPREAARLLKNASWRDANGDGILEKSGKKLRIHLYYNSEVEEFRKLADLIAQDLFEIGIGVETVPATTGEIVSINLASGNYDAILDVKASHDDINSRTWTSSSIYNISRLNSMEMDTLLDRLREAMDVEQKKEIYSKMQRIFEEEIPAVFLYSPVIYTAVNKRFKGAEEFVGDASGIYKIKDWSVNEDFR